ncbi:MAG: hypothetical protein GY926_20605 [bacterium]|nr:hypothetical protein [bacterium]
MDSGSPTTTPVRDGAVERGPARLVLRLLPLGMVVMVCIDEMLGDSAEYFNASGLLRAWGSTLSGDGLGGQHFLIGQEGLGGAWSLAVGSTAFVLEPAMVLAVLVFGASKLRSVFGSRSAPR